MPAGAQDLGVNPALDEAGFCVATIADPTTVEYLTTLAFISSS